MSEYFYQLFLGKNLSNLISITKGTLVLLLSILTASGGETKTLFKPFHNVKEV